MKKIAAGLLAAAALAVTLPALAQAPGGKNPIPPKTFFSAQLPGESLAKDKLIGVNVTNAAGNVIGKVDDLIFDRENRIVGVVMSVGGFLGMADKRVGVRLPALVQGTKDGVATLSLPTVTKEVLAAIPEYKRAEPKKGLIQRAKESAKGTIDRGTETAKDAADKMKEMVKPSTPAPAPTGAAPAPMAPAPAAPGPAIPAPMAPAPAPEVKK